MSPYPSSGPGQEGALGTQVLELRWPHPWGTRHGAQPGFLQFVPWHLPASSVLALQTFPLTFAEAERVGAQAPSGHLPS